MTIPTYDQFMLPVLRRCAEHDWRMADLIEQVSSDAGLTAEERSQRIPSGQTPVVAVRVHWARTYLKEAGLLSAPRRAWVSLTDRGRALLVENPPKIDRAVLMRFPEFREFQTRRKIINGGTQAPAEPASDAVEAHLTPEELIDQASAENDRALKHDLLRQILAGAPAKFENLIVDLLIGMGYGGSRAEAGESLGRSGDEGVDGVIREDRLGLDRIYLQAKRYQPGNVVRPEAVRGFIGALAGQSAQKGVFITTSTFSDQAKVAATQASQFRVVLIDGDELTRLMIRFNIGVRVGRVVEIKRIDTDYFESDEAE